MSSMLLPADDADDDNDSNASGTGFFRLSSQPMICGMMVDGDDSDDDDGDGDI